MIIREAVSSDIQGITEIYNWAVENSTATFDIVPQTLEARKQWLSHYGGQYPLIVCEKDGKIAGYASLSKFREKEAYARTVELSVYVHPDFQQQGIGRALMLKVIEMGKQLKHHTIISVITTGNDVSVRMHEQLGFSYTGELKGVGYKFDRWLDVVFYQLMI